MRSVRLVYEVREACLRVREACLRVRASVSCQCPCVSLMSVSVRQSITVSEWGVSPRIVHLRIYLLLKFYENALKWSSPVRTVLGCMALSLSRYT